MLIIIGEKKGDIMKLGLLRDEVKIVSYTEEWEKEFLQIKEKLIKNTGLGNERIEHIGSTSIKNMPAKPIIDILIGIDDLALVNKRFIDALDTVGFKRLKVKRPSEIVFAKFEDDTFQIKTHYIHLVNFDGELWNNLIFFRDYLNTHEIARAEYLRVKKEYLNKKDTGIKEYTDYKESFVKEILTRRGK